MSSLRYRTKQFLFVSMLVLCAVASAGTAWWSAGRAKDNLTTVRLADEVLTRHLTLAASANDLFKQYADALLIGDRDRGAREGFLRESIGQDIDAIREVITREIRLQGEEEVEELNRLARIERELNLIDNEFARVTRLRERESEQAAFTALIRLLDDRIDGRLRTLIDEAVEEERREVEETANEAQALQRKTQALTQLVFAVTIIVALLALVVLNRSLNRPLRALVRGTEAIRRGRLDHRIALQSKDEFGLLASQFDEMASELQASRDEVERSKRSLEDEVQERTRELEATNRKLGEQDTLRRRFLADVSHELRTPLTVLRGETEVVLRDRNAQLGDAARAVLEGTVEQVNQMSRLVDDLLFVARREAGEARLALRPVQLPQLVATAVKDARALSARSGVAIEFDPPAEPIVVEADTGRLRQLLLILLDNAVRYSNPDAQVRVFVIRHLQGVTVRVEDDGMGIPADDLPHVFDRFVRGSNVVASGSGLGLPVAKAIAQAHRGELLLESEEGSGTVSSIVLPIAGGPRAVGREPERAGQRGEAKA